MFRADLLTVDLVDVMVDLCPSDALRREENMLVYDIGACTACGRCIAAAGDASRPSGSVELATTARDELVKRIPILRTGA